LYWRFDDATKLAWIDVPDNFKPSGERMGDGFGGLAARQIRLLAHRSALVDGFFSGTANRRSLVLSRTLTNTGCSFKGKRTSSS
jgi:hypothetical protein